MSERDRLLEYLQDNHGLDLCKAVKISRGSIYVHLGALEDEGLVDRKQDPVGSDGRVPRPMYRASRSGGLPLGAAGQLV